MKRLLTTVFAVAAVALAAGTVDAKEWKKVRLGVEGAYPPFSYVDPDGRLAGFDIEIAQALCDQMRVECPMVQQDWDGIIPALLARKYDAIIASMSITEERKKKVAFTGKYYNTPGKTVGVQRATTYDNFITAEFGSGVKLKRYATQDEAYLDAAAGRLDLLMADSVAMKDGFLITEQGQAWEFVGPDYLDPKYFGVGAGIAIRKQDKDLVAAFNRAIKAIRANGTYDRIAKKYFDFDVYGK
jgi:arginine/ornithine transport system substrate-binding protein